MDIAREQIKTIDDENGKYSSLPEHKTAREIKSKSEKKIGT